MARRFGADVIIDVTKTIAEERIRQVIKLAGGFGADLVLECVGTPQAVTEGLEFCRDGGRYLVLGHYGDAGTIPFNPHMVTRKQLVIAGSWGFEPRHTHAGLAFLSGTRERFPFEGCVTAKFPLERAFEALETTASLSSCKNVIVP